MDDSVGIDALVEWVLQSSDAAEVVDIEVRAMDVGSAAVRIQRLQLTVAYPDGGSDVMGFVRKWTWAHEALGLEAAQEIRNVASAIPELIARGTDGASTWLITPFYDGGQPEDGQIPAEVIGALVHLHASWLDNWGDLRGIPVVNSAWWEDLCQSYLVPGLDRLASSSSNPALDEARRFVVAVAKDEVVARVLDPLPRTLLHGDVRPDNFVVGPEQSWLIDWGSARIGPQMLDLAELGWSGGKQFEPYARLWRAVTGLPLGPGALDRGYKWTALQNTVQGFAWIAEVEGQASLGRAVSRASQALRELRSLD